MIIRIATEQDAGSVQQIYAPYVRNTAITFEYDVPDRSEFIRRIRHTLEKYPYLIAEEAGRVVGYAYAGPFRTRAAYDHSAEVSIYMDPEYAGRGIGSALYLELEKRLVRQNVFVLYACITETERENDAYLTDGSIRFHERMGYELTGSFYHCGYKFGRWYSMRYMVKVPVPRPEQPDDFLPFSMIEQSGTV